MSEDTSKLFAHVTADEVGVELMRCIMNECGFLKSSIAFDSNGAVSTDKMLMMEANRNLWLRLREFIPVEKLAQIELKTTISAPAKAAITPERTSKWQKMNQALAGMNQPIWEESPQ